MASEKVKMTLDEEAIERSIERSIKRSIKRLIKSYEEAEYQYLRRAEDRMRVEDQMGFFETLREKLLDVIWDFSAYDVLITCFVLYFFICILIPTSMFNYGSAREALVQEAHN